jgi:hypothetical protein
MLHFAMHGELSCSAANLTDKSVSQDPSEISLFQAKLGLPPFHARNMLQAHSTRGKHGTTALFKYCFFLPLLLRFLLPSFFGHLVSHSTASTFSDTRKVGTSFF